MPDRIATSPISKTLVGAAAACIEHRTGEWWSLAVLPCTEIFQVVEQFTGRHDEVETMSPEHAAYFLLLAGEAIH